MRNILAGASSGALYKCTKGFHASMIGAIMGASIIGAFSLLTKYLREKEIIQFEMKFDD